MLPDLRMIDPQLLEDDIEWALQDSMGADWTCATGASAVMGLLRGIAAQRERGLGLWPSVEKVIEATSPADAISILANYISALAGIETGTADTPKSESVPKG